MLNSTYRIIGDIIGRDNEAVNYLDTIHTELYDIGILQVAEGMGQLFSHSLDEIPYQLAHYVNGTIQQWINMDYILIVVNYFGIIEIQPTNSSQ